MSLDRKLLFIPPVLAGAALLAYAVANRTPPEVVEVAEPAVAVRYVTATPRRYAPRIKGFGGVEPAHVWDAVAEVRGRVVETHPNLRRGGAVRAGEVVVRIAEEEYALAVARAEAEIEAAELAVQEGRLQLETTGDLLAIERQALQIAERELERQRDLVARGVASSAAAEGQERAMLAQRARAQELENRLALAPVQISALEKSLEVAQARLRIAELDLARTEVRAPFDGRVAQAEVEVSQYVAPGALMARIDGIAEAEIDVQIPPNRMAAFGRLAMRGGARPPGPGGGAPVGLSAVVSTAVSGVDAEWEAEVRRISDTVDPETRSVGVIVAVTDPYGKAQAGTRPPLIKGMFVEVSLFGPPVESMVLIPRAALRDGRAMVAGGDDRLAFAAVEVAYVDGDVAVIAGGLADGDRVIVSDLAPAIEGMLLAPARDAATEARLAAAGEGRGAE